MVPSSYVRVAAEGTTDEKIFFILVTILKERKREKKKRSIVVYIEKHVQPTATRNMRRREGRILPPTIREDEKKNFI